MFRDGSEMFFNTPMARWFAVFVSLCASWLGEAAAAADVSVDKQPAPNRLEPGVVPVIAGDSDVGVGLGAVGSLARFRRECSLPYCWRAEALLYFTIKRADDGGAQLPYHDDYIKLDLPGLLGGALRLYLQLGFGRYTNSGYYGMGNAAPALDGVPSQYHQYDRIYPQLQGRARLSLRPYLSMVLGASVAYNWITIYPGSKLGEDLASGDAATRDLLQGTSSHALGELSVGWIWDSRDHETVPNRGMFHEVSWRVCPGLSAGADIAYSGLNLTLRFYQGLIRDRLGVALRLMTDLLFGSPPFYELARSGGLSPSGAVGGGAAVRGVPLHRYHGKAKLVSNIELRARLLSFKVRSQRFNLGALAFADAGRVWAGYGSLPSLDGSGVGLKFGLGSGLRLQWGETFLLRADVAWSPDASPIGVYVDVGHIF